MWYVEMKFLTPLSPVEQKRDNATYTKKQAYNMALIVGGYVISRINLLFSPCCKSLSVIILRRRCC